MEIHVLQTQSDRGRERSGLACLGGGWVVHAGLPDGSALCGADIRVDGGVGKTSAFRLSLSD
jgi:hypothetical protein